MIWAVILIVCEFLTVKAANTWFPAQPYKDYVPEGDDLNSIAAGTGEMDYRQILSFMKARKPYIQATLENTTNDNAVQSREMLEQLYSTL